ncbi:PREDICTED: rho GDP-dissociation inhibitor 1 [Tarenaya hassleriana]|uniref:rho GDP-dissociation inhibitor 1 n=1 Tax=Tarenaya hassleriana TaxID=28532 RepID=UPI00053C3BB4|nr:PREDICTED: rho GDP-dissociation inhibitor 1 [Tarenaya hassleriana]
MPVVAGAISSSRDMGFDEKKNKGGGKGEENTSKTVSSHYESTDEESMGRQMSEVSLGATEEEEEDEASLGEKLQLGPQYTIKEHLEKDKDDESLRKWKEQLLGSVDMNSTGETLDPEVKILSLVIVSPGRPDTVLSIPEGGNIKGLWFTLKEGSKYNLKFTFQVSNNIVSGLRYTSTVWKTGVKVDRTKEMLGTFSPQLEPYTHMIPEESTPSGIFARGSYSARTKFLDDDNKCYLEINYTFDIRKEWPAT